MAAPKGNSYAVGNPGGGRPSTYKDEYAKIAYSLALLGATDVDLAEAFDVSETTINNWKKEHEDFYLALKNGKQLADANVAKSLYNRALGYEIEEEKVFNDNGKPLIIKAKKHYPADPTSMIYWLKNRQPKKWRDRPDSGEEEVRDISVNVNIVPPKDED